VNRIAGSKTSANAAALSQENLRSLSCHGQINRKSVPPLKELLRARASLEQSGGTIQTAALRSLGKGRSGPARLFQPLPPPPHPDPPNPQVNAGTGMTVFRVSQTFRLRPGTARSIASRGSAIRNEFVNHVQCLQNRTIVEQTT